MTTPTFSKRTRRGLGLVGYTLILSLMAVGAAGSMSMVGGETSRMLAQAGDAMDGVPTPEDPASDPPPEEPPEPPAGCVLQPFATRSGNPMLWTFAWLFVARRRRFRFRRRRLRRR